MRKPTRELIWNVAAEHHDGGGLEGGADLKLISKHVKPFEKRDNHWTASSLHIVLEGRIWSGARKVKAGLWDATAVCPHCVHSNQDGIHITANV